MSQVSCDNELEPIATEVGPAVVRDSEVAPLRIRPRNAGPAAAAPSSVCWRRTGVWSGARALQEASPLLAASAVEVGAVVGRPCPWLEATALDM